MDEALLEAHRAIVTAKHKATRHPDIQRRLDLADRTILLCGYLLAEQERRTAHRRRHLRVVS